MQNASIKPLTVACGADAKYALSLAVTLYSMLTTLKRGTSVDLYIVDGGLGETMPRLKKVVERAARTNHLDCRLQVLTVDEDVANVLKELPMMSYYNYTCYLRLLLPDLLPPDTEKVIYIDSDLMFLESVEEIWETDMSGKAVLAVQDYVVQTVSSPSGLSDYAALGYKPDQWYFNSGFLVIDLKQWRDEQIPARVIRYSRERPEQIQYADQDGLNAVLAGDCGFLDLRWNAIVLTPYLNDWSNSEFKERIRPRFAELLAHPAIVHYASVSKPYVTGNYALLRRRWFRFLFQSGWFTPAAFLSFYYKWVMPQSLSSAEVKWKKLQTRAGLKRASGP